MISTQKHQQNDIISPRAHPVLQAFRSLRRGTFSVTLPGGKQIFYNGSESGIRADMRVHHWDALDYIASRGDVGLGEGYMMGLWDTANLKNMLHLLVENIEAFDKTYVDGSAFYKLFYALKNKLRLNTTAGSMKNVHAHYDLGNDFYKLWLDETMTYSGALFKGDAALPLAVAQKAKYQRILDRLCPSPGDHILEIGCGWGGFMEAAAKNGCRVTGVTLSQAQAELARERLAKAALWHLTEVHLQDYRAVAEKFDYVVSIGMFEHVGEEFWQEYMQKVKSVLKPSGKAMIQSIVVRDDRFESYRRSCDFAREHIFPGGMLPSASRFRAEAERAGLQIRDTFFFGGDYAITLEKWLQKFEDNLREIKDLGYDDAFIRKWRFYLSGCAATFRSGRINLMQAELTVPSLTIK